VTDVMVSEKADGLAAGVSKCFALAFPKSKLSGVIDFSENQLD
jgi:hypothetical protein